MVSQYGSVSQKNRSEVIYCFDCDEYDTKPQDANFLNTVEQYCKSCGADFVWFCKDIERTYLGKKVEKNQKKDEARKFKEKNLIHKINASQLSVSEYQKNTSNILLILDKYLERK